MVHKIARYKVKPEHVQAVHAAVATFVDAVRAAEPGTLRYEAFAEPDGVSFIHFMSFKDEGAEAHHRTTPHVMAFVAELYPKCEVAPAFTDVTLVRSSSLPRP